MVKVYCRGRCHKAIHSNVSYSQSLPYWQEDLVGGEASKELHVSVAEEEAKIAEIGVHHLVLARVASIGGLEAQVMALWTACGNLQQKDMGN